MATDLTVTAIRIVMLQELERIKAKFNTPNFTLMDIGAELISLGTFAWRRADMTPEEIKNHLNIMADAMAEGMAQGQAILDQLAPKPH